MSINVKQIAALSNIGAGVSGLVRKKKGANEHQAKMQHRSSLIKLLKGVGINADVPEKLTDADAAKLVEQAFAKVPEAVIANMGVKDDNVAHEVLAKVAGITNKLQDSVSQAVAGGEVSPMAIAKEVAASVEGVDPDSDMAAAMTIINNGLSMVGAEGIDENTTIEGGDDEH